MVDAKLTDIDGVGPARSESLEEGGYESVEAISEADSEELAEAVDIPEDTALGFVVQAENMVAEEEADIEEREPVTQEIEEEVKEIDEDDEENLEEEVEELEEEIEDEVEEVDAEEGEEVYSFEIEPKTALEHDVLFASVMRGKETMLQANRTNTELFDNLLDQMRSSEVGEVIELEADKDGLNQLHNHVRKLVVEYQGNNLIDHMNAMKEIQQQVNAVRKDRLF